MTLLEFAVVLILSTGCNGADITVQMSSVNDLGGGHFQGHFRFPVRGQDIMAWEAILTFDAPVNGLTVSFTVSSPISFPFFCFRPHFWDLLLLLLLRPDPLNLPCLYSTFHLKYPSVDLRSPFFI